MKKPDFLKCFVAGAVCYPAIEIAWRGRTHPVMAAAGGFSVAAVGVISKQRACRLLKCAASSAAITAIELITGALFNKNKKIWDYTGVPLNFKGQICLLYSVYWGILSYPVIVMLEKKR